MSEGEAPYDPAAAAIPAPAAAGGGIGGGGGRGRGRGRGRGGGGVAIEGIAELDASMGRGTPVPPAGGGGKPLPKKDQKDFRGPAGLFKQGDWTCTVCGNVNWERRSNCNKCQNQKPNLATTEEAREGLGGGFNERQDRASVATVEVDEDGYDDFGRKKIKARADKKAKEDAALARLRKSFGGGMLGGTSLAPTGKPPVPGQFDDATPAPSVTTYDEFGRPKLAGAGRSSGGGGGGGGSNGNGASAAATGRDRDGRGDNRDRDRDRRDGRGGDSDRRRGGRSRSRSRSRERSSRDDKDRSRRRRSRSRSRDRRR